MNTKHKHHIRSIAILSSVLILVAIASFSNIGRNARGSTMPLSLHESVGYGLAASIAGRQQLPDSSRYRVAKRLRRRLRGRGDGTSPPIHELAKAVAVRQKLLKNNVVVTIATEDNAEHQLLYASVQRNPLWIVPTIELTQANFRIHPGRIQETLESSDVIKVDPPVNAILTEVIDHEDEKAQPRAEIDTVGEAGYIPDTSLIAHSIAKAYEEDIDAITVPLPKIQPRIINRSSRDLGELRLWTQGRSNFHGSTWARQQNVHKALTEHVNNTLVAPGETFSFNSTLGGPVTEWNGWKMAKVIFNGGDLEAAPGGGICQASTTVFRAAVNAGFPVVDRRSHSLYVSYYKEYGVGIDATIYPGTQDLVFLNDTGNYLVIQAYRDGSDAYVNVYGTPDGRTVELNGPYFARTAPKDFRYMNRRQIASNEIVWRQRVSYPDGRLTVYDIASRYKELPMTLANEYVPTVIHAAAPTEKEM